MNYDTTELFAEINAYRRRSAAWKEECELFIDSNLAPMAKKIMESLKDLGESAGERSNEEEE